MSANLAVGVYRGLLRSYPQAFRNEYGADMLLVFTDQLRNEPALRVWGRVLLDLALTVPTRHLETHMDRPRSSLTPLLFTGIAATGALVGLIGGSNLGMLLGGLSVAGAAGLLAVVSWRRGQAIVAPRRATSEWWKLLTLGVGALVAMIIAEGATDLSLWWPMVVTVLLATVLIGAGVVLGVVHIVARMRPTASSS